MWFTVRRIVRATYDSEIIEIEVRAHRRKIQRRRYKPSWKLKGQKGIITAPGPARLLPKTRLGTSVWAEVGSDKFWYYRPTYRLLCDLRSHGLDLAQGTITDGLRHLIPIFEPIEIAIIEQNIEEKAHWHADETRWEVWVENSVQTGHRWYS